MRTGWRAFLPSIVTLGAAGALVVYGPIPQLANYHAFADERVLFGIPHWGDVVSNVGFAVVAVWGLRLLTCTRRAGRLGYGLFVISLLLTSIGSAFYHWAPDNSRLLWDRLPIALACAGLLAAVRSESKPGSNETVWTMSLALAAVASVLWWHFTERAGQGDLRPYLLLQGLPLVLIPLWQSHAGAPAAERVAIGAAIALYVAAKLAEVNDHLLYVHLHVIGGHTIKHLLATMAAAAVVMPLGWHAGRSPARMRRMTPAPLNS
jgi:hypothetical protein